MRFWIYYVKSKYLFMTICCLFMFSIYSMYFLHVKMRIEEMKLSKAMQYKERKRYVPRPAIFAANQSKIVLLLSYQRSGSSFTGQLFNQNPEVLYFFEPVDSIYHAMYGTQHGYTVPSDIYFFWNGSKRAIPEYEQQNVANSLETFFNCDLESVPQEMLNHKFMDSSDSFFGKNTGSIEPYVSCLKDKEKCNCDPPKQRCAKALKHTCPINFGENHDRHLKCYEALWNNRADLSYFTNTDVDTFYEYNLCMRRINDAMQQQCVPLLQRMCSKAKIKAMKTVRLNMKTAEILVQRMPNLRIIHLIRDPRGVVLSRRREGSFHGHYSGSDMVKEAELYCKQVLEDAQHRKLLEEKYPGTSMQVIYEAFTMDPIKHAASMYNFFNESFPSQVERWLYNNTKGIIKDSKTIAAKWQNRLSYIVSKNISIACSDFYNKVRFEWP